MINWIKSIISHLTDPLIDLDWLDDISADELDLPEPAVTTDSYINVLNEKKF